MDSYRHQRDLYVCLLVVISMFCPNCKKEISSGKFCPECGTALVADSPATWCPNCNREYQKGKFCPECGTPLVPKPAAHMASEPQQPSFSPHENRNQNVDLFEEARSQEFGLRGYQDMESAAQLYLQAAEAGNADAMCHIGYLLLYGFGIERNTSQALMWMEQGVSMSRNPNSDYCKNAGILLGKVKQAPHQFLHEEARYPALLDNIKEYNDFALSHGYKPLVMKNGLLSGTAVDDSSLYYNRKEKQHYLNFASLNPTAVGGKKSFFGSFKEDFNVGFLGGRFILIVRELIALGID